MDFSDRQKRIIEIVKESEPISGDNIAAKLGLTKPTLRNDLSILTMTGVLDARPKVGYIYSGQRVEPLLFEKLFLKKVSDLMIPPVLIHSNTIIRDAITDLFVYDVGSLFVVDEEGDNLVGVLSRKDLLRSALTSGQQDFPVAVVMTRKPNIYTITPDESILAAGTMLMLHQVDSLPVVKAGTTDEIVGKITKTRIMNFLIQEGNKVREDNEY